MTARGALTVGVPKETKTAEHRVALTPDGVRELERHGVEVFVEAGAGVDSAVPDADFERAGATIVPTAADAWSQQMVVKVKEPQGEELTYLRSDLTLFTYLHLAAYPEVAKALLGAGTTGIAYETVEKADGSLPLLAPMSEVAGRLAPQMGAHYLERHNGGRGVLMGGAPGVRPARVVVLGRGQRRLERGLDRGGHGGRGLPARQEPRPVALGRPDQQGPHHDVGLEPRHGGADRGRGGSGHRRRARRRWPRTGRGRARTWSRSMLPGAVIVDVAVDQGGCIETTHETTHNDPVYERHGVIHYAVGNMPGAVPYTSTYALTNATLPYILEVAVHGPLEASAHGPDARPRDQHGRRPGDERPGGRVPGPAGGRSAHGPRRLTGRATVPR